MSEERLVPASDWIVMDEIQHDEKTAGGIVLAKPGDYDSLKTDRERRDHRPDSENQKHQSRNTFRGRVLAVGPGIFADVADEVRDRVFLRRPMSCVVGDVVLIQGMPHPLPVNGAFKHMAHDYQVLAVVRTDEAGGEVLDPQNDYLFMRQAAAIRTSVGGIYMPHDADQTGNRAMPDRWEVLGVGDGPWCLRQERGTIPAWARRPMPAAVGDTLAFEGAGFLVSAMGAQMCVIQAYQVAGVFSHGHP